jgi:hypothetical protein
VALAALAVAAGVTACASPWTPPDLSPAQRANAAADAQALTDPARRQDALCRLLRLALYRQRPPYPEMPCGPVNEVIVAPQLDGQPLYMVFHGEAWPDEDIGPGRAHGGFTIFDHGGYIVPVPGGANYLHAGDVVRAPVGNGPLAMFQVYGHASGSAFEPDSWSVEVLHVVPVARDGGPTLAIALGPATIGFQDGCEGPAWSWRLLDADGDGIAEIEIGPRIGDGEAIAPAATFRWSAGRRTYVGPPGSPRDAYLALEARDTCAISGHLETYAREQKRLGITNDRPGWIRRYACKTGSLEGVVAVP